MDCAAGWLQLQNIWTIILSLGLSFAAGSLTVPAGAWTPGRLAGAMKLCFLGISALQFTSASELDDALNIEYYF